MHLSKPNQNINFNKEIFACIVISQILITLEEELIRIIYQYSLSI